MSVGVKKVMGKHTGVVSKYLERIDRHLTNKIKTYCEEKGFDSYEEAEKELTKDLPPLENKVYVGKKWRDLVIETKDVNLNTISAYNGGSLLESHIPEATYIKQKGLLKIDILQALKNRVFNEEEKEDTK